MTPPSAPEVRWSRRAAARARHSLGGLRRLGSGAGRDFARLSDAEAVSLAFTMLLRRAPDSAGAAHYLEELRSGRLTRRQLVESLLSSTEFRQNTAFTDTNISMHLSRCQFVQGLPRAGTILDLGGTDQADARGALLSLGYPYPFTRLVVVDLPPADRHELYQTTSFRRAETPLGPVDYAYHSMVDLSPYDDATFDLVYSGQSIEHVTEAEGKTVIEEVHRVLRPGGWFCLDTPNGPVWRLLTPDLINPDHKIEYAHHHLRSALEAGGFEVVGALGLNYAGASLAEGHLALEEAAANVGVYAEIESCLNLAYVCRKPW